MSSSNGDFLTDFALVTIAVYEHMRVGLDCMEHS